jgi:hypothetical protein
MDPNDPAATPRGAHYLPEIPVPALEFERGVNPFPGVNMCNQYEDYILTTNNRSILTSRRRSKIREILRTPSILYSSIPDRAERARL